MEAFDFMTRTQRFESLIAEVDQLAAQSRGPAARRHFHTAITKLEEALMHINRGCALRTGDASWWDPELTPRR